MAACSLSLKLRPEVESENSIAKCDILEFGNRDFCDEIPKVIQVEVGFIDVLINFFSLNGARWTLKSVEKSCLMVPRGEKWGRVWKICILTYL